MKRKIFRAMNKSHVNVRLLFCSAAFHSNRLPHDYFYMLRCVCFPLFSCSPRALVLVNCSVFLCFTVWYVKDAHGKCVAFCASNWTRRSFDGESFARLFASSLSFFRARSVITAVRECIYTLHEAKNEKEKQTNNFLFVRTHSVRLLLSSPYNSLLVDVNIIVVVVAAVAVVVYRSVYSSLLYMTFFESVHQLRFGHQSTHMFTQRPSVSRVVCIFFLSSLLLLYSNIL